MQHGTQYIHCTRYTFGERVKMATSMSVSLSLAATAMKMPLASLYSYIMIVEKKKPQYNRRVVHMTVEQGTFTPLVFSVFGTAVPECKVFLKQLCTKVADKQQDTYNIHQCNVIWNER